MSKTLPAAGVGPKAKLNAGQTLYIYTKKCEPEDIDTSTEPVPPTTTTRAAPPSSTTKPPTTTSRTGG
ncbi:hypothetical protein ACFQZZ_04510 [Nocardia sp. GCM10030253]|uniref:hypothetical protein n=1 Tax=Nocardia sp. GCM10030253 TaxID=3273404 RepID=UPI0036337608